MREDNLDDNIESLSLMGCCLLVLSTVFASGVGVGMFVMWWLQ